MATATGANPLAERVAAIERELDTERRHLATKADLIEASAALQARINVLQRDMRWGLLVLTLIAAGEWLPQIRSWFF